MFGSTSCTGTLLSPQTFIHLSSNLATWYRRIYLASRQHGNSPLKGLPTPISALWGVFFFLLLLNGHRSQNTATLHRSPCYPTGIFTIWQPASGRLSVFSASASKMSHRKETRRKEKPSRKDSITKCQVLTKTEKYKHIFRHMNTHAYTRTFFF